jgi:hypothetical protein
MPHDFILQRITISIITLSKHVREKKQKNQHLYRVVPPPGTNAPPATSEGGRHICTGPRLHPVQM